MLSPLVVKADTLTIVDTINVMQNSRITTDNLGNLFVISPTNDIEKYDKNGHKLATANFKVLGNISSIDANNPFEIYVFYRDQNKILFLDNLLNLRGEVDLESIGISQIACMGRSGDNQIWLVDMGDLKLKKYSKDLKLILESAAINTLPFMESINPEKILDINNAVLILNNGSIYEFDIFANYTKLKLTDSISMFQYVNEKIFYKVKNEFKWFNPLTFAAKTFEMTLPFLPKSIRIEKERLYVLGNHSVILYAYSEN
jgi:hypothetical protein